MVALINALPGWLEGEQSLIYWRYFDMTKSTDANAAIEAGNAAIDKVTTPGEMTKAIRKELHNTMAAVNKAIRATKTIGS